MKGENSTSVPPACEPYIGGDECLYMLNVFLNWLDPPIHRVERSACVSVTYDAVMSAGN